MIESSARIVCDVHGHAARPGWIVCRHMLDCRVPTFHMATPEKGEVGVMICPECFRRYGDLDQLEVMCPECVDDLLRARELSP